MNGGIIFVIVLVFLVLAGYGGWVAWSRIQANRLGLPPPSLNPFARTTAAPNYPAPAPGGIRGWVETQIRKFKNRNNRYATGAYEESSYGGGRGRGHRLDPDEAWDARVGNEAHYEEQELGLHAPIDHHNDYDARNNTAYGAPSPGFQSTEPERERGRSRTREYDGDSLHTTNPFGDDAAASLRGVSPRPLETEDTSYGGARGHVKGQSVDDSPTERRSASRF
jgi:hypothetical protein